MISLQSFNAVYRKNLGFLGACPRIGTGRFIAPAKQALPPSMAVVARGIHFESDFSIK
jgi:hypothetical protein